jgi:hypothetical protein
VAQNAGECGRVVIFQFDRVLFALLAKMLALHSPSMKITTHSEASVRPAHLSEVLILSTHDYLVYLNFGTIAELDGQVGVGAFVEPLAGVHDRDAWWEASGGLRVCVRSGMSKGKS